MKPRAEAELLPAQSVDSGALVKFQPSGHGHATVVVGDFLRSLFGGRASVLPLPDNAQGVSTCQDLRDLLLSDRWCCCSLTLQLFMIY